jgi:hypothetical protein
MKKIKIFLGITWAFLCLILILVLFPGLNSFSGSVSKLPFMKLNARYSGGEVAKQIVAASCTLDIRKPVFNGFFKDRKNGFVQLDWRGTLPETMKDSVDYDNDGIRDFCITVNTKDMKSIVEPFNVKVKDVLISTPTSYGWAVRVGLIK